MTERERRRVDVVAEHGTEVVGIGDAATSGNLDDRQVRRGKKVFGVFET